MLISREKTALSFYLGLFFSSLGTFTFNLALIAFMLQGGFHLGLATLIIGTQRFVPVLISTAWGHFTDTWPAQKTIAFAEGIAALASVGLLLLWDGANTNYLMLLLLCNIRAIVVSFQLGSRAKITKLLSENSFSSQSRHAVWFNKTTQGATLLSGLSAWLIIRYFNFQTAVIFDALTFLVNGLIAVSLPNLDNAAQARGLIQKWTQKFADLFHYNPRAAVLDVLLVTSMLGTVAFMTRVAGSDQSWTGIFMASYGLAVWVSGFMERGLTSKISTCPFWVILGLSYIAIGHLGSPGIATLCFFFIKDLSFWIIFHRISGYIQHDTPVSKIGSVMTARNCVMTVIMASGEVFVGMWSRAVPIASESNVRAAVLLSVGLFLIATRVRQPALVLDRPAL